jgi:hypothetical protein
MAEPRSKLDEQVASAARQHFGRDATYDDALAHIKAIKVILAADGVSQTEAWAFHKALLDVGMPEPLRREAEAFDATRERLEDVLRGVPRGSRRARELIRGAIRVSTVDGYSPREREKVMQAGWLLGLEPKLIYALEASVDLENRVRELGDPDLREKVAQVSHALLIAGG